PFVPEIARQPVGRVSELDLFSRRNDRRRGAVGAGEGPEVVVEGSVLFDDEDDVLNLRAKGGKLLDRRRRGGNDLRVLRGGHPVVRFSGRGGGGDQQQGHRPCTSVGGHD